MRIKIFHSKTSKKICIFMYIYVYASVCVCTYKYINIKIKSIIRVIIFHVLYEYTFFFLFDFSNMESFFLCMLCNISIHDFIFIFEYVIFFFVGLLHFMISFTKIVFIARMMSFFFLYERSRKQKTDGIYSNYHTCTKTMQWHRCAANHNY